MKIKQFDDALEVLPTNVYRKSMIPNQTKNLGSVDIYLSDFARLLQTH